MKKQFKMLLLVAVLIMSTLGESISAFATTLPYDTYNYDYWDDIVYTPAAFTPEKSYSGVSLGTTNFNNPSDLYVSEDGIYVADRGNARVVKLNLEMTEVLEEITTFNYNGTEMKFSEPCGVCVSESNMLYVADRSQKKIWVLDEDRNVTLVIENPQSEILDDDFDFTPLKVAVDYANRVYVVAAGKTEGILVFDSEGNFTSFFGTISVKISVWERFWRKLSTKAQRSKQVLYIATEFTGLDVDPDGFVYTTNYDNDGEQAVMKLNPKGEDVIRKGEKGTIAGDIQINGNSDYAGASTIVDVVYRGKGIYSVLDSKRGRVFTYDSEGNLLYVFGGLGSQAGTFSQPVAIEQLGNKILVLDAGRKEIMVFSPTEYGSLIDEAVGLRYDGDETQAVDVWKQVLTLDENFELANDGIGKAYLTSGDNKQAMKYLKLAMDKKYYSVAFRRYRNEWLKAHLQYILTVIIVIIIAWIVLSKILKSRKGKSAVKEGLL
jgi:hypothetical protein